MEKPVIEEKKNELKSAPEAIAQPVTEKQAAPVVQETAKPVIEEKKENLPTEEKVVVPVVTEENKTTEEIPADVEETKASTSFGRDEEDFILLFFRDHGSEKEAHYGKEIAGSGSILRVISEYESGQKTESLVFVPGASIIDLYEDPEDPGKLTGRTLAKK